MSDVAVSVQALSKQYRIMHQQARYGRLSESIASLARAPLDRLRGRPREQAEWFWALRDVSLELKVGEVLGVVGRNGAGKSTLLKILSRVTEPTAGRAEMVGRVASLLEVGTGFHPELTGRENIYLSGSILGMRRQDMTRRFDEIVEFAGVEQFLDTPVKRFSSGMQVRLGFAVAAHLEPEILIVDEVLAVGDAAFQKKCLAKLGEAARHGRTTIFVSHNMPAVQSLCTSGVLLDEGCVAFIGAVNDTVERYLRQSSEQRSWNLAQRTDRQGDGRIRFVAVESSLRTGSDGQIVLDYEGEPDLENVEVAVGLFDTNGGGAAHFSTASTATDFGPMPAQGRMVCQVRRLPMVPGSYAANLYCTVNGTVADWVINAATIDVSPGDYFGTGKLPPLGYGSVLIAHAWEARARP